MWASPYERFHEKLKDFAVPALDITSNDQDIFPGNSWFERIKVALQEIGVPPITFSVELSDTVAEILVHHDYEGLVNLFRKRNF